MFYLSLDVRYMRRVAVAGSSRYQSESLGLVDEYVTWLGTHWQRLDRCIAVATRLNWLCKVLRDI